MDAILRLVGGRDYRYYVEADGDDSVLDGRNFAEAARQRRWFDNGLWRIELQPGSERKQDHFLVTLTPSSEQPRNGPMSSLETTGDNARVLVTEDSLVGFTAQARGEPLELNLPGQQQKLYVAGFPPRAKVTIGAGGTRFTRQFSDAGVLVWELLPDTKESNSLVWY